MPISEKIRNWLGNSAARVLPAESLAHGDYTTNLAIVTRQEANVLKEKLEQTKPVEIEKIEVAGPGFLNFYLSRDYLAQNLQGILNKKDKFGWNENLKNKKIIVEYTDPNPFKEFHIGHLMSNAIGESLSRLIEASGAEVKRACYQGDVGLHVAKALWPRNIVETWYETNDPSILGKSYVEGAKAYEKMEFQGEIKAINKKLYEKSDPELNRWYEKGKELSLKNFERIYERLGTHFDFYFFESGVAEFGKKLVEANVGKIFEASDGAIVFRAEKFDKKLHTRVFINSDGLPTYEAKELGLAKIKSDKFNYDESLIITANEIDQYFRVLLKALEQVYPDLAAKTRHVSHGFLRLPSGKMSSRTGDVVTAENLLKQVSERVLEKTNSAQADSTTTEQIAVAAIKFEILKQAPGRDIVFDINKSLSLEGDSGPYLQYTHARAKSVLAKSGKKSDLADLEISEPARLLARYPDIVARAAEALSPQLIVQYLLQLASSFNSFYAQNKIIGHEREQSRLALTESVAQVLRNGLWLLGIKAPERM